jgi:hypothetical protein
VTVLLSYPSRMYTITSYETGLMRFSSTSNAGRME